MELHRYEIEISKANSERQKFRNEYIFKNSQLYNQDHIGHKLTLKIKSSIKDISKQIEINISYYEYFRLLAQENSFYISINDKMDNIPRIVIFNSIKNFNNLQRLYDFWMNYKIKIENKLQQLQQFNEKTTKNYGMICILMKYYKNVIVDVPIYDLINEIEEDNLLKGDLAENLTELEICDNEEL
ncbi:hypothetical protein GLOIN_2v1886648 [Rhizophagus irregularis DAOM 181602=DAOM 197198]|nr:hypothetical protein GLOIN_2v1886648 [Rhizophagus irregularis DAOM 181602=DAOM 197198]